MCDLHFIKAAADYTEPWVYAAQPVKRPLISRRIARILGISVTGRPVSHTDWQVGLTQDQKKRSSSHIVRKWIRSIAPFALVLGAMVWLDFHLAAGAQLQKGSTAPAFKVLAVDYGSTDSTTFDLAQQKNVVVLNFWASWCPPCIAEIPDLNEISHTQSDTVIVGLTIDARNASQLQEWRARHNIEYTLATGSDELLSMYGVRMLPTTVILNRHGQVSKTITGQVSKAVMLNAIRSAQSE